MRVVKEATAALCKGPSVNKQQESIIENTSEHNVLNGHNDSDVGPSRWRARACARVRSHAANEQEEEEQQQEQQEEQQEEQEEERTRVSCDLAQTFSPHLDKISGQQRSAPTRRLKSAPSLGHSAGAQ
ncbi:hypothetical protein M0804_011283 [Polistes exclamans]|nr:hypothetical protein M0804_011283 [Polistes exclamans]